MEQHYSATHPTYAGVLIDSPSDHGLLNDAWLRDLHADPSVPVELIAPFRRQRMVTLEQGRGYDVIPVVEAPDVKQSAPAGTNLVNTPIADYRTASDEQLLAASRSSDGRAFVELSGRYKELLHKKVFRIVRNREDTEDVVQETFFKAYVHLGEFRGSCRFSSWLTKIAINSALMLLRKRRSRPEVSFDQARDDKQSWGEWEFPDPSPGAEQIYTSQQTADALLRAVRGLPPSYRCVVEEYHGGERSLREAADILGITVSAAKSRLLRARLFIRSTLEKSGLSLRTRVTQKRKTSHGPQAVAPEFRSRFVSTTSG
jgi:RNA polymerase sigma-70 factor, ECF subfamily